jgi:Domain of unknown function (DUF4833)
MTAKFRALILALSVGLIAAPADSAEPKAHAVSLFTIGKSQNKNQVQYAVHVDGQCVPIPGAPVFAYWRMLELGPTRVEPLLARELSAYGPTSQQVTARRADGGEVRLVLRALPNRSIVVETRRAADGTCRALATVAIAGSPAHLFSVYVKLTWRLSVDYLLLRGWSMDGTRILTEKLSA